MELKAHHVGIFFILVILAMALGAAIFGDTTATLQPTPIPKEVIAAILHPEFCIPPTVDDTPALQTRKIKTRKFSIHRRTK